MNKIDNELLLRKQTWEKKKILRRIYHQWYSYFHFYLKDGRTFEVSSGFGNFKEYYPKCITSDIMFNPWVDMVADAMQLPLKSESITNLVCIDGLHHLENPYLFLSEAQRVLKEGGRLIFFEPYLSPFAYLIRKLFHHEDINKYSEFSMSKTPLEANLAIPTLIFCKKFENFQNEFLNVPPALTIYLTFFLNHLNYYLSLTTLSTLTD